MALARKPCACSGAITLTLREPLAVLPLEPFPTCRNGPPPMTALTGWRGAFLESEGAGEPAQRGHRRVDLGYWACSANTVELNGVVLSHERDRRRNEDGASEPRAL